jgi:hypothetical protein
MLPTESKPRVAIGMACEDIMHVSTCQSIGCAIIAEPRIVDFLVYKGCDIVSARTALVKKAIEKGMTHLCFVDSDQFFGPDTITRLLAHKKEIVGVEYNKRKFPLEKVTAPLDTESKTELYKARSAGAGMLLIDLSIFTNKEKPMGTPWFNFGRDKEGKLVTGEDVWFISMARDSGYDTWIDPTISVKHLGEFAF